jgi:hypothetical protein
VDGGIVLVHFAKSAIVGSGGPPRKSLREIHTVKLSIYPAIAIWYGRIWVIIKMDIPSGASGIEVK